MAFLLFQQKCFCDKLNAKREALYKSFLTFNAGKLLVTLRIFFQKSLSFFVQLLSQILKMLIEMLEKLCFLCGVFTSHIGLKFPSP